MKTLEDTEQELRDASLRTTPELDDRILANAGLALDAALSGSRARKSTAAAWWTGASRSRPVQFAAAAAILIALLFITEFGIVLQTGVAWAEVPDRMARVDRYMFRLTTHGNNLSMAYFASSTLGTRWDLYRDDRLATSIIVPARTDSGIAINHGERTWSRIDSAGAPAGGISPVRDPEAWVRRFLDRDRTAIGRSTIDGVEVEGVEVIDPPTQFGPGGEDGPRMRGRGRLWVSVESGLPVRIELLPEGDPEATTWTLDFRWGTQVDASTFEATVPDGFTMAR